MKTLMKLFTVLGLLFVCAGVSHAQNSLTQTTLSSAITVGLSGSNSGIATGGFQTTVTLGSGTGVTVALNGQPVTILYIDAEAFGVLGNPSGTTYTVLRGLYGTKTAPHASGTMVLLQNIQPALGGFAGGGGLQVTDPPFNGKCTGTNTLVTPWLNMLTGAQWLCSSITNTWVPGWNNPYDTGSTKNTAAVASAAGLITPSGPLFHITGTSAITGFNIPVGFNATGEGGGQICAIPDGIFTTTTANNIALASTAVVNKLLCWTWDATNSKFVPSY